MVDINEMITNAAAEEAAMRAIQEQEKARRERQESEAQEKSGQVGDTTVTIRLDEYIRLNLIENDYCYLLTGFAKSASYSPATSYSEESLVFDQSYLNNMLGLINPEAYDEMMATERERERNSGKNRK